MMKSQIFLWLLTLSAFNVIFSQDLNSKSQDPETDKMVLTGYCDRAGLEKDVFGEFFKQYYSSYDVDKDLAKEIRGMSEGFSILIILGTWCHDSKEQVPRFYKILDKAHWPKDQISQICVNSSKEASSLDVSSYDVQKVPIFIIYKNGVEIGRIVETPMMSLEEDILLIMGG